MPQYADRAAALAARTYELTQFLVDVLGVTDVGARSGDRLTYHPACHGLRGLGVARQPLALLEDGDRPRSSARCRMPRRVADSAGCSR